MRTSRTNNPDDLNQTKRVFTKNMQEKLAITVMVIMLALFALVYKLYKIQNDNSAVYNQKILSQQRYDSRDIPYRRGDIVDRNGTYLATSDKVFNIIIDPSQINSDQEDYLEPTIDLLNEIFGYDKDELKKIIADKSDSQYIRYDKQLSYDQKTQFETRKNEINNQNKLNGDQHRVYGIWFEDSYLRTYPYDSLACNVIGFANGDGESGTGGIEQYYNSDLMGVSGREYGYLNDDNNLERVIKPATDGHTIVSTIDTNIQTIVEKYIKQWEDESGSKVTACIVMNPDNGEVLAMATSHIFNLNNPRDLTSYYTQQEIDAMDDKTKSDTWNSIWRNFCVNDTYEPGSTSKIFTIASALEEGAINGSESFECDGFLEIGGWKIRCSKRTGHGLLTVEEGLMQSCNVVMMKVAALEGKENFTKFMQIFGFGSKTDIDLPGEADTSSLVHTAENMGITDLATNSFGQNYNCSMIQMAAAYCSVINGGSYYKPHVVKQILNSQGSVVKNMEPELVRETVSASTTKFINEALRRTVAEGTGSSAKVEGYEIAGKTGTAEKYPRGTGNYLVSFCGFAPADNPEVLCYVIIDEPHLEDQAHSSFAGIIFSNIMKEVLPYMNIFPSVDMSASTDANLQLPEQEGISDGAEIPEETTAAITYDTDEVVETAEAVNSREDIPGVPAGGSNTTETALENNKTYDTDESIDDSNQTNETVTEAQTRANTVSETSKTSEVSKSKETTIKEETTTANETKATQEETIAPLPTDSVGDGP